MRPNEPVERARGEGGQGLLELVVILPVLLILMLGVAEIGLGFRNYIVIVNADREAARFAARGRFDDDEVAERVVSAGGIVRIDGSSVPFLRTYGTDPNTGIIVTHLEMDPEGEEITQTVYYTGVVPVAGGVSGIGEGDSRVLLAEIRERQRTTQQEVNTLRSAGLYESINNHLVAVEVFFAHPPLMLSSLVPMPDPWPMYARTVMRVTRGR